MTPEKALELASQFGIVNVVLILALFFSFWLVFYVLREGRSREKEQAQANKERDERWAVLYEKLELRTDERHLRNQEAMSKLAEADRRQREEHEVILSNQKIMTEQHRQIATLLENLLLKAKIS